MAGPVERPATWREWKARQRRWARWTSPDWALRWAVHTLKGWGAFQALDLAGKASVVVALVVWVMEADSRRQQKHYQAWSMINAARGGSGDGGRISALQDLNQDKVSLAGLSVPAAMLAGIRLSMADLHGANFAKANLAEANLSEADLREADMQAADIRQANLTGATLRRTNLSLANLWRTNLSRADLTGADLSGAYLGEANLKVADLTGADLSGADLRGADLEGADLSGVDMRRAVLPDGKVWGLEVPPPPEALVRTAGPVAKGHFP